MSTLTEAAILIALIAALAALTLIVIVSGVESIPATGLRDLAVLLAGALAGSKVPKQ